MLNQLGSDESRNPSSNRFKVDKVQSVDDMPMSSLTNGNSVVSSVGSSNNTFDESSSNETNNFDDEFEMSPKQVHFIVGSGNIRKLISDEPIGTSYHAPNASDYRNMHTVERAPHIDHYRNVLSVTKAISERPTLADLREGNETYEINNGEENRLINEFERSNVMSKKLGWIKGVLIRCILCILGVMLFLRLSWVTAQAGIGLGCLIVLLGSTVTTLTALSLCAISTNGEVKGGGAYFLISRSLGPEFGGSIGIIFSCANAVAAAMYMVGFAESVQDVMKIYGSKIVDSSINDVRIIALCTAILLLGVVLIGVQFETKAQLVLLIVLGVSLFSYYFGTIIPPNDYQRARGVTGLSRSTFVHNFFPDWRNGESFITVFAVYFPAATGIMAGANISGDLSDPQKAIPKGTLLSILLTTIIYLSIVVTTGATCFRDASGNLSELSDNADLFHCSVHKNCSYGLHNYFQIMELESIVGPLVTAGIFAATLSSALASLVSAPKVFQALCKDRLFPFIASFAKGFGSSDEPRPAYFLSFFIACGIICIGDLNHIAPIISNFFLASYALINYACFNASFAKSPGFRPAFKFYNLWLSLFGSALCVVVMFLISWWTALITFAIILALYVYLLRRKPDVNWGSSSQAHAYRNALNAMLRLAQIEEHVKNYRPQILLLSGNPIMRPLLVDFATNITKDTSLLICGHIIVHPTPEKVHSLTQNLFGQITNWIHRNKIKSFYVHVAAKKFDEGAHQLIQLSGFAKLKPNILLIGFKTNWRSCDANEIEEYVNMIHFAFDNHLGVAILRTSKGFDISDHLKCFDEEIARSDFSGGIGSYTPMAHLSSFTRQYGYGFSSCPSFQISERSNASPSHYSLTNPIHTEQVTVQVNENGHGLVSQEQTTELSLELTNYMTQFKTRQKKATIDVYWLFDDGGLTLLLPHLLTMSKSYLEGARLRIFTIAKSKDQLEQEQRSMASLLNKFRIEFADVFVIPDIAQTPRIESISDFERLIEPFLEDDSGRDKFITENELNIQKDKTHRQIRTRELMSKYSSDSTLIALTMPIPRRNVCSPALYMAWLETLSSNLPPVLLIRGNQQSVLTFYS